MRTRQCLGDLGQLPVRGAERLERSLRIDGDLHPLENLPSTFDHRPVVDQAGFARFGVQENVLRHRQRGHQAELLEDHADSSPLGVVNGRERDSAPGDIDGSRVKAVDPLEDLHERGLPSAIAPSERVYFAGKHLEVDIIKHLHPVECLVDADHADDWGPRGSCRGSVSGGAHPSCMAHFT